MRMRSNSARSASVKNCRLPYLALRWNGVSYSTVQMPCRSGSPQGVLSEEACADGACADVLLTDIDMAPSAAAATATVTSEPENRSSIDGLLAVLLERILLNAHEVRGVVLGGRVGAMPLRERKVLHAGRLHHRREREISLQAARLVIDPVGLVALAGPFLLDGPGPRPHGRVLDHRHVFQRAVGEP